MSARSITDKRILLISPTAHDAATCSASLVEDGMECRVCERLDELCELIDEGIAAIVVPEEVVMQTTGTRLVATLANQKPSARIPLIVLTADVGQSAATIRQILHTDQVTLLKRPFKTAEFLKTVRAALRDRRSESWSRIDERRLPAIQNDLLESDSRLRFALQAGQLGSWDLEVQTKELICSDLFKAIHGREAVAPFSYHDFCSAIHIDDRNRVVEAIQEAIDHRIDCAIDYRTTWPDGTSHSVTMRGQLIGNGGSVRLSGVALDLTDRKRAEEDLRKSEGRLWAFVSATTDAVYRMSADWSKMLHLDGRGSLQDTGIPTKSWVEKYIPPDERTRVLSVIRDAIKNKSVYELEHRVNRLDGSIGYTFSRAVPVFDDNDRIVEWLGAASDITARREARETIARLTREAEQKKRLYETALSNTPDLVYVFDLSHRFTYANTALLNLWGVSRDQTIGRTCLELGYPSWLAAMHDAEIDLVFEKKISVRGEFPVTTDSARRFYEYVFSPVLTATGEVEAIAGTARDVTERKVLEEDLRGADKRKDDFIALLAHELRNPLAPIRNGLQVMRLSGDDPNVVAQSRSIMERQLSHMVRLVDELLDISQLSRHKMTLRRERVLLADVINAAIEATRPLLDAASHELVVELPSSPIFIDADPFRLTQIFGNLVTNSAKFTSPGGRIRVTAERTDGQVVVKVHDNGIGISPESLESVFDMFSQADRTIERATGGLGIGLALTRGLVEMHGGTVHAASAGVGRGSVFTIELPIAEDSLLPKGEVLPSGDQTSRRVLVVDDNHDGAATMSMMLKLLGNDVVVAHDGVEAVQKADTLRPDLILMDVAMPRMNGLEATRQIRRLPWKASPIIIAVTGWGQDSDIRRSLDAGCDGHLVKPVVLSDLQDMLSNVSAARISDLV